MPKVVKGRGGGGREKKGTREDDRSSQELEANALMQIVQIVRACIEIACIYSGQGCQTCLESIWQMLKNCRLGLEFVVGTKSTV